MITDAEKAEEVLSFFSSIFRGDDPTLVGHFFIRKTTGPIGMLQAEIAFVLSGEEFSVFGLAGQPKMRGSAEGALESECVRFRDGGFAGDNLIYGFSG